MVKREFIYLWYYFSVQMEQIFGYWALGSTVLAARFIICLLCGIGAGLCIRYFYQGRKFFKFTAFKPAAGRDTDPNLLLRLLKNIGRNIKATGGFFLMGVLLSALFQRYVPADLFANLFQGQNEWLKYQ